MNSYWHITHTHTHTHTHNRFMTLLDWLNNVTETTACTLQLINQEGK